MRIHHDGLACSVSSAAQPILEYDIQCFVNTILEHATGYVS